MDYQSLLLSILLFDAHIIWKSDHKNIHKDKHLTSVLETPTFPILFHLLPKEHYIVIQTHKIDTQENIVSFCKGILIKLS